jgi:hypothetical protein
LAYITRWVNPEKVMGKVKEIKTFHFGAKEENGMVVKGNFTQGFRDQYNSSGTILSFVTLDSIGGINPKGRSVQVEAEGKIIKKAIYFWNDTLRFYTNNTYTGDYLTEVKFFDSKNDTLVGIVKYNYDQNGNLIKCQTFNNKNVSGFALEFSYNSDGIRKGSKQYSASGEMTNVFEYLFNDRGKIIGNHREDVVNGVTQEFEHREEYDKKGNWVKRVQYEDKKPVIIIEREIKYYD